ncbi:hypothetical protein GDO81_007959 [Engystomops pustulosus]|nr:hypothetical protein GDO81_007959 [Engystomops pustulosus]
MPTKGEGAIGSLDYTPDERKALAKKSQDYFCEACGISMKSALLPLNSESSRDDKEDRELARQISFTAQVNPPGSSQTDANKQLQKLPEPNQTITTTEAETPDGQPNSREEATQSTPTVNTSRSPRQRRAHQRRNPASPGLIEVQHQAVNGSNTGSAILIVVLTFALAALLFRRLYLANEYIFDYDL